MVFLSRFVLPSVSFVKTRSNKRDWKGNGQSSSAEGSECDHTSKDTGEWPEDERLQTRSWAPTSMSWRWTWAPSAPSATSCSPSPRHMSTWTSSCMYGHLWKTPDIQSLAPRFCCWTHPHCNLNSETCFSEETMQGLWPALTSYPRMGLSCSLQWIMLVSTIPVNWVKKSLSHVSIRGFALLIWPELLLLLLFGS